MLHQQPELCSPSSKKEGARGPRKHGLKKADLFSEKEKNEEGLSSEKKNQSKNVIDESSQLMKAAEKANWTDIEDYH
ncbi:unnamed protein product [Ambrosiozyma monospora]|uniref:Unnamed protein product n=1 Tax=Ambrosiozyma monospora TaxID=43982 RepID=A0A9W6YQE2_AMBMO|nr:unnamed protein product [Ambrosiozyma monospora]